MIRNIVFDVGYVLVDYTWKYTFKDFGYDDEGVKRLAAGIFGGGVQGEALTLWQSYDNGLVSDAQVRADILRRFPDDAPALTWFFDNAADWCTVRHDLADRIAPLKEKGYGIFLLSNYPDRLWQLHVAAQAFHALVDGEVVSYAEHIGKPGLHFYERLLARYRLNAEECLFLDDRRDNTLAAESLGMQTLTLDSPDARRRAVETLAALPKLEQPCPVDWIETADLLLAKGRLSDWRGMYENVWSHAETARYMLWSVTTSEPDAIARMERTIRFQSEHDTYLVYDKHSLRPIGFAGLELLDAESCGETGIALGPAFVRRGYGKQIVQALCRRAKTVYGAKTFIYSAREKNMASRALAASLGFQPFERETRLDERNGELYTLIRYRLAL